MKERKFITDEWMDVRICRQKKIRKEGGRVGENEAWLRGKECRERKS